MLSEVCKEISDLCRASRSKQFKNPKRESRRLKKPNKLQRCVAVNPAGNRADVISQKYGHYVNHCVVE